MTDKKVNIEDTNSDDEEVIDLCDNINYQVLSAVFETESGKNVADILNADGHTFFQIGHIIEGND